MLDVRQKFGGVWETTLTILLDHSEASIVREQAAMLLTNLCSHVNTSASGLVTLPLCHAPLSSNNQVFIILWKETFCVLNQKCLKGYFGDRYTNIPVKRIQLF